jgi:hypothetical protein
MQGIQDSGNKFKYIKSLYIIDIKSAPPCQFDSSNYFNKCLKIFNYFRSPNEFFFIGLYPQTFFQPMKPAFRTLNPEPVTLMS